jgi:hypothetical protein
MIITRRRFLGFSVGAALGGLGYGAYSNTAEVVDVRSTLRGLENDLRVLFVSDLHLPRCFVPEGTLGDVAKAFRPHLFCVGGDSVDRAGNEGLVDRFGEIDTELGKFAVLGNWEYGGDCDLEMLRRRYARAGVQLLVNATTELRGPGHAAIRVVGLDDLRGGHPRPVLAAPPRAGSTPATIVLAHCPALFDRLPPTPLICLSGHTHGGQIAPLGLVLYCPPGSGPYVSGSYRAGSQRQLYVTRGLGNNGVGLRIGARPEIVRLTLSPASA